MKDIMEITMKIIKIEKQAWAAGLESLRKSYRLFGPRRGEEFHLFQDLAPGQAPDFDLQNTRLSPKAMIYPQSEVMFRYSLDAKDPDHHVLHEAQPDPMPRAVIGIRPCDAAAFGLVRRNFDTPEYQDPYWIRAYEATTLVGLACDRPCGTCFCTTAGSGPYDETGLDLLLAEDEGHYLAKVLTPKGEALVEAAGWHATPEAADGAAQLEARKQHAEGKIVSRIDAEALPNTAATQFYDAPFWEEVAFACINCGTCTYVCPTCWCFDIQDETSGTRGVRLRNWDSCMYPLFTLHGSGHNPRGAKVQRVRQRFMHKLKYYVDKYGNGIQCVGCGRCVRLCPVNI
ncbi:MAG: 4Fe-4S dicluster domain-containing protein, partial [Desulfobacterales bacterium]|nr:4Fe-4S dicluster domain-containing protein [Desulfobacterales bacterium]